MARNRFLLFVIIVQLLFSCKQESERAIDLQGVTNFLPSNIKLTSLSQITDSSFFAGTENGVIYLIENDSIKRVFNTNINTPIYKVGAQLNQDTIIHIGFRDRKGFQRWNSNGTFEVSKKFSIIIKDSFSVYNFYKISEHSKDYIIASSNGLYRTNLPSDTLELLYPPREIVESSDDYRFAIYNLVQYKKGNFLFSATKGLLCYDALSNKVDTLFENPDVQHISIFKDSTYILSSDSLYVMCDGSVVSRIASPVKDAKSFYNIDNGYWFFSGQSLKILRDKELREFDNIINIKSKSSRNILASTSDFIYFISASGGKKIVRNSVALTNQAIGLSAVDPVNKTAYFLNHENLIFRMNPNTNFAVLIGKLSPDQEFKRMLAYKERLYFMSTNAILSYDKPQFWQLHQNLKCIFRKDSKEDFKSVAISGDKLLIGTDIRLYSRDMTSGIIDTLLRENIESIYNPGVFKNDTCIVKSLTNSIHCVSNGKVVTPNKRLCLINIIKENECDNLIVINDSLFIAVNTSHIDMVSIVNGSNKSKIFLKSSSILPWGTVALNDSLLLLSGDEGCRVINIYNQRDVKSIIFSDRNPGRQVLTIIFTSLAFFLLLVSLRFIYKTRKNRLFAREKQGGQQQLKNQLDHRIGDLRILMSFFPVETEHYITIKQLIVESESYLMEEEGRYKEDFLDFISHSISDLNREKGNIETYQNLINSKVEKLKSLGIERKFYSNIDLYCILDLKRADAELNTEINTLSQNLLFEQIKSIEKQISKLRSSKIFNTEDYCEISAVAIKNKNPDTLSSIYKDNERVLGIIDNLITRITTLENEMATWYILEDVNKETACKISNIINGSNKISISDCEKILEEVESDINTLKMTKSPEIDSLVDSLSSNLYELEESDVIVIKEQIAEMKKCNDSFSALKSLKNLTTQIEQARLLKIIAENKRTAQYIDSINFHEELKRVNTFFKLLLPEDAGIILESLSIRGFETDHASVFCILLAQPEVEKKILDKVLMGKDSSSRRSEVKKRLNDNVDKLCLLKSQVVSYRIQKIIDSVKK